MAATPNNYYLKNDDLLKEIHKSKTTYCSYIDNKYEMYDLIVETIEDIPTNIPNAIQNRADRLNEEINNIQKSDLVFRVMTHEHIPFAKYRRKGTNGKVRVNFPPFQHYVYNDIGQLICVGKSHWVDYTNGGYFSFTHGRLTETLGQMYITLANKYATKGNIRDYSYNDEMKSNAISQLVVAGLNFNEFKSKYAFAYITRIVINAFTSVINTEKQVQNIRDNILEMNNLIPSYTRQLEWFEE